MCDVIALAFQTDKTRVATLLLCRDLSGLFYPFLDVRTAHHPTSHEDHSDAYERVILDALIGDPSKASRELGWSPRVHTPQLATLMVDADLATASGADLIFASNRIPGFKLFVEICERHERPVATWQQARAILGALRAGVIDVLIVDEGNARAATVPRRSRTTLPRR